MIAGIVDRDTLGAYLDALTDDRQRDVAVRVALRSAARVSPSAARGFLSTDRARERDLIPVAAFGVVAVSGGEALPLWPEGAPDGFKDASDVAIASDKRIDVFQHGFSEGKPWATEFLQYLGEQRMPEIMP